MKIWIFEDRRTKALSIKMGLLMKKNRDLTFEALETVEAGDRALNEISDDDVLFVDSQVPSEATGLFDNDAGERLVAKLRATGSLCRILWHSTSYVDSLKKLGVEDLNLMTSATDLDSLVFAAIGPEPRTAAKEEWKRNGQAVLAKLTTRQTPLSEFVPLSILCQGYLAIVGAAGLFPNEVADKLKKSEIGRECIAQAHAHLDQALNYAEWFAAGLEKISAAVKRGGAGEEVYWRGVDEGQAELEKVATIRRLYERMGEQGNKEAGEELHRLVADAHRSLQSLFARRYL